MSEAFKERIVAGVRISNPDRIFYSPQGITTGAELAGS